MSDAIYMFKSRTHRKLNALPSTVLSFYHGKMSDGEMGYFSFHSPDDSFSLVAHRKTVPPLRPKAVDVHLMFNIGAPYRGISSVDYLLSQEVTYMTNSVVSKVPTHIVDGLFKDLKRTVYKKYSAITINQCLAQIHDQNARIVADIQNKQGAMEHLEKTNDGVMTWMKLSDAMDELRKKEADLQRDTYVLGALDALKLD